MVVELVPFITILHLRCIVAGLQLPKVVADCEQVIHRLLFICLAHHVVTQIEPRSWKLNKHILLCVIASEALEVDDKNGRHVEKLDLFHCLLVLHTLVAVPGVGLTQILRFVELSEAVVNADLLGIVLLVTRLETRVFIVDKPV